MTGIVEGSARLLSGCAAAVSMQPYFGKTPPTITGVRVIDKRFEQLLNKLSGGLLLI